MSRLSAVKILNHLKLMKGVDLRQIIHKHYFGTDITEMKVDDKGQVAYQGKRVLFLTNFSDSERDKEVDRNH